MTTKKQILEEMDKIELKDKFRRMTKEENEAWIQGYENCRKFIKRQSWVIRLFNLY